MNLSIEAELVDRAKALDINLSQALEAKLRDIVREEETSRWQREHEGAIDAWNLWIEENGIPLDDLRAW
ncbi:MAG: type II toxin-antitoxin system CcdA family antitoxin [Bauldia sp.]